MWRSELTLREKESDRFQDTIYCLKCGRRAKHQHPLKAFRRKDEEVSSLRKHLTLSYHEHIVACTSKQCLQTCHDSRYARKHFRNCKKRPSRLADIIEDGAVRFDDASCSSCGLFITCMFLHADKCRETGCQVEWCDEIRATFDMGVDQRPVYLVTKEMEQKCRDVHRAEWLKVEDRKRDALLEDLLTISL